MTSTPGMPPETPNSPLNSPLDYRELAGRNRTEMQAWRDEAKKAPQPALTLGYNLIANLLEDNAAANAPMRIAGAGTAWQRLQPGTYQREQFTTSLAKAIEAQGANDE